MTMYLLALAIGTVAGLRAFTPLAAIRWPYANWTSWLAIAFALGEFVADKLPAIPPRTDIGSRIVRGVSGGFCAWSLAVPMGANGIIAIVIGVVGSLIGTQVGYAWRLDAAPALKIPALAAGIIEDAVAIVVAFWLVLGAH
jgi:uncharacterized membrane protein